MPVSPRAAFAEALGERILVFDGAMGTMLQAERLDEAGFRGAAFADHPQPLQGLHDVLSLTRPELVERVHRRYLDAGADALTTNTFNGSAVSLADYGLADRAFELNRLGAENARRAIAAHAASENGGGRPRFVLGSMGPTNRTLSISPDVSDPSRRAVTWDELRAAYLEQARGLLAGGTDILLVETCFDTLNAKAALDAAAEAVRESPRNAGLLVSFTAVDREDATSRARTPSPSGSPWSTRASPPAGSTAPSAPR